MSVKKASKNKLRLKTGDKVIVISGKDKGKTGNIVKVFTAARKVLVEGVNLKTKHKKVDTNTQEGGKIKVEAPIHISNVMYYCESLGKGSRIGYKVNSDQMKVRYCKKSGEEIEESTK